MAAKVLSFPVTMKFGTQEDTIYPSLLVDAHQMILVDCGYIGALPIVESELRKLGISIGQLTGLVITHHDHDHMGAAAALLRANPAITVYASTRETPYITAAEKPLRLRQAEELQKNLPQEQQGFGKAFCEMLRCVEPVAVDVCVEDGTQLDWCGGCTFITTPGHTPGHVSLYLERESVIITGDAFALEQGKPVIANPQFTLDIKQAEQSMRKLLGLPADTYYCYHGGIYLPKQA